MTAATPMMIDKSVSAASSLSSCSSQQSRRRALQLSVQEFGDDHFDIDALAWQRPILRRAQNARITKANACWNSHDLPHRNKSLSPPRKAELLLHSSVGMKRRTQQQHSHRLRAILQADLRIAPGKGATRNNKDKQCLSDYKKDIDSLLHSLHSTNFVGKIDPKYHSQYFPTSKTMPTF
ncbi:hypothetical protein IV203_034193 [Nitzschia inconspicua]|uniref:Uncharacterized protein n=1 Tax=Nitzschia inconspicua TaxID=303405 RepID=A0A9K3Q9L7_9STRA|nr:hypothetical protein IV203_034193 [Nitzschia inconspicua]